MQRAATYRGWLLLALVVSALLCSAAVYCSRLEPETERAVSDGVADITVIFDYRVVPLSCALFPQPQSLGPGSVFFLRVTDRVDVSIKVTVDSLRQGSLRCRLDRRLRAGDLWNRSEEQARQSIDVTPGSHEFAISTSLDIGAIDQFLARVEEETQVYPDQPYQIILRPEIEYAFEPAGEGEPQTGSFAPEMSFALDMGRRLIKPSGGVKHQHAVSVQRVEVIPSPLRLGRLALPVPLARGLSALLAGVSVLVCIVLYSLHREAGRLDENLDEVDRINRRYGKRLVPASELIVQGPHVRLRSFRDLLALSDQTDQPVIYALAYEGERRPVYAVMDMGNTFMYFPRVDPSGIGSRGGRPPL